MVPEVDHNRMCCSSSYVSPRFLAVGSCACWVSFVFCLVGKATPLVGCHCPVEVMRLVVLRSHVCSFFLASVHRKNRALLPEFRLLYSQSGPRSVGQVSYLSLISWSHRFTIFTPGTLYELVCGVVRCVGMSVSRLGAWSSQRSSFSFVFNGAGVAVVPTLVDWPFRKSGMPFLQERGRLAVRADESSLD